ncbi:hypothetical protein BHE18_13580 [Rossellomorea aquimaris]|uniref:Uncharacterized protein n=1 Tax=Rossellomorea aquimaris TaxID=189382 RepID=A0A1J6VNN4_9BACI|nr:hypothetical protein BHE18_13580 [Rossellomorea aquimaris]
MEWSLIGVGGTLFCVLFMCKKVKLLGGGVRYGNRYLRKQNNGFDNIFLFLIINGWFLIIYHDF